MAKYRKKSLVEAIEITDENLEQLKSAGVYVNQYNERSKDAFVDHAKVGETIIWTEYHPKTLQPTIRFAQCKTIEGLHTAQLPSMLMIGENGDKYFCTKEIFDKTYEPSGPSLSQAHSKTEGEAEIRKLSNEWRKHFRQICTEDGGDAAMTWLENEVVWPLQHIIGYQEARIKELESKDSLQEIKGKLEKEIGEIKEVMKRFKKDSPINRGYKREVDAYEKVLEWLSLSVTPLQTDK